MKRRNFLKASALASTSIFVPTFLQGLSAKPLLRTRSGKTLIVIQLSGGNDGLNTVIPFQNDIYYQKRPKLAIPGKEVLQLTDELGFHPKMKGLRALYDEGLVSIVNSVGYPNPDRSHFRSINIWHTASDSNEYLSTGWLGRYLDHSCHGCAAHHAIEVDDSISLAMKGIEHSGFAVSNAIQLKKTTDNTFLRTAGKYFHNHNHEEDNVAYLYKTMIDTQSSADYLYQKAKVYQSKEKYPLTPFGRDLKRIAELITADADTKIYYASLGGFDTHVNQANQQARLLENYSNSITALVRDLQKNNLLDDTLIMTFSEFGRRVQQNASNGTDHGTANNLFLIGGKLRKPGFFNKAPDLTQLDKNDLLHEIDFRQVYATILESWLDAHPDQILPRQFTGLGLL